MRMPTIPSPQTRSGQRRDWRGQTAQAIAPKAATTTSAINRPRALPSDQLVGGYVPCMKPRSGASPMTTNPIAPQASNQKMAAAVSHPVTSGLDPDVRMGLMSATAECCDIWPGMSMASPRHGSIGRSEERDRGGVAGEAAAHMILRAATNVSGSTAAGAHSARQATAATRSLTIGPARSQAASSVTIRAGWSCAIGVAMEWHRARHRATARNGTRKSRRCRRPLLGSRHVVDPELVPARARDACGGSDQHERAWPKSPDGAGGSNGRLGHAHSLRTDAGAKSSCPDG